MQRRIRMETYTLVALLSIITILIQYGAYYFLASYILIILISSLIPIISVHILLEKSFSYEAGFVYMLLNIFMGLFITALSYSGNDSSFIPYNTAMLGILAVNWIIPVMQCFLRNMFDYGTRIEGYNIYYRKTSIIFNAFYLGLIIYGFFTPKGFPWPYPFVIEETNFTPLISISIQIEDLLMDTTSVKEILLYLANRIFIFIPYGFYIALLFRKNQKLLRLFALLLFPIAIEVIQYFNYPTRCDIDDVILGFLGGLLGIILYYFTNSIYKSTSGRNFLALDANSRYSGTRLHF